MVNSPGTKTLESGPGWTLKAQRARDVVLKTKIRTVVKLASNSHQAADKLSTNCCPSVGNINIKSTMMPTTLSELPSSSARVASTKSKKSNQWVNWQGDATKKMTYHPVKALVFCCKTNLVMWPSGCLSKKEVCAFSTSSFSTPSFFTNNSTTLSFNSVILCWSPKTALIKCHMSKRSADSARGNHGEIATVK